jgi:DNA-binding transcriptional MerR regulator
MTYTIGQVADLFHLPVSTLRYYDKEGLFPTMERQSGIRKFSERELEALRVIDCLKRSGLEIKEIKQFMTWCTEGPETYPDRLALFEARKQALEEEMQQLRKTLDMLTFKCWYYETAIRDGSEERLQTMLPDKLPPDIQTLYDHAHTDSAKSGQG